MPEHLGSWQGRVHTEKIGMCMHAGKPEVRKIDAQVCRW